MRDPLFTVPEMAAVFSGRSFVQRMLDFEAALARAQARAGLVPQAAAEAIRAKCRAELYDLDALFREAAEAATPAVPLVRMLTALLEGDAKKFVHWGATSQDAVDTATMLQMRDGLDLLATRLLEIGATCAALADGHRHTPMAGRTLLQHAVPITFGLKAARWLALSTRLVRRLRGLRASALAVQLGGAAGTLAALGGDGVRVTESLAQELGLPAPDLPWHTERDRIADIAGALGSTAGSMAKAATDIALLSQMEVSEVSTGAGEIKGRSSTMPHKRNPVEAISAVACARLAIGVVPVLLGAMVQEHERAAGGWQAEWQAVPDLFNFTAGAATWTHRALANLEVHPDRMLTNLDQAGGLIMAEALTMALAPALGRPEAYRLVQRATDRAAATGANLSVIAAADDQIRAVLPPDKLARVFDVANYLGSTDALIDRALAAFRTLRQETAARS